MCRHATAETHEITHTHTHMHVPARKTHTHTHAKDTCTSMYQRERHTHTHTHITQHNDMHTNMHQTHTQQRVSHSALVHACIRRGGLTTPQTCRKALACPKCMRSKQPSAHTRTTRLPPLLSPSLLLRFTAGHSSCVASPSPPPLRFIPQPH